MIIVNQTESKIYLLNLIINKNIKLKHVNSKLNMKNKNNKDDQSNESKLLKQKIKVIETKNNNLSLENKELQNNVD